MELDTTLIKLHEFAAFFRFGTTVRCDGGRIEEFLMFQRGAARLLGGLRGHRLSFGPHLHHAHYEGDT